MVLVVVNGVGVGVGGGVDVGVGVGADDYLSKPFEPKELLLIDRCLSLNSALCMLWHAV